MSAAIWAEVLVAVLVLGALTVLLSWTAGRLDRLHIRLATAHASLDRHLVDRAACTTALAVSGVLDPAASLLLLDAASQVRTGERNAGESALSRTLRTVLGEEEMAALEASVGDDVPEGGSYDGADGGADNGGRALLADLAAACDRVRLAAAFHTDLVMRTTRQRRRLLVRWLHLAGHAPWPRAEPLDVAPPQPLLDRVARWR